jgi:hypothetical protein
MAKKRHLFQILTAFGLVIGAFRERFDNICTMNKKFRQSFLQNSSYCLYISVLIGTIRATEVINEKDFWFYSIGS